MRSRILHGAAFAAALLLCTGLLLQKAAAATTLTLSWKASPSSPNIDGYRVYYGRIRVEGKEIKRSLQTTDRELARRKLADFRKEQRQIDRSAGKLTLDALSW